MTHFDIVIMGESLLNVWLGSSWLVPYFGRYRNNRVAVRQISVTRCVDIRGRQWMKPIDFGDSLTFTIAPPGG